MDKGLKILFDTYWSSKGWKDSYDVSQDDFAIAKAEGYMFDGVPFSDHDEMLAETRRVLARIDRTAVADAFLFSLSTRRLEYRSALGSYFYAAAIPDHIHDKNVGVLGDRKCYVCGFNIFETPSEAWNVFNFERYKWGGVRHDNINYALFDLKQFLRLPKVEPKAEDIRIFRRILSCVDKLNDRDKVGKLRDVVLKEKIFATNRAELSILLGILGICGVLASDEFPCYAEKFVDEYERGPQEYKNDFAYPVNRWRKSDGINEKKLTDIFPLLQADGEPLDNA